MVRLRVNKPFIRAVRIQTGHQFKFCHLMFRGIICLTDLPVSNILISGLISHTVEDTRSKILYRIPAVICAVVEQILVRGHIDVNDEHRSAGISIVIHHFQRIRSLKQFLPIRIHFQRILFILRSFRKQIVESAGRLRHQFSFRIFPIVFVCLCFPCNGAEAVDRVILVTGHFFGDMAITLNANNVLQPISSERADLLPGCIRHS